MKPGDIVRARTGTTIEIVNTDAEGRLVLADCLAYAIEQGAERLVDLATLTGAIVSALGSTMAGPDGQRRRVGRAGPRGGRARRRADLAAAVARGVRRADQGPLRRHRQRGREPQGRLDHRGRVPAPLRLATCRGRTSTSPASPTTTAGPTRTRAARASACDCWWSWRARTPGRPTCTDVHVGARRAARPRSPRPLRAVRARRHAVRGDRRGDAEHARPVRPRANAGRASSRRSGSRTPRSTSTAT